MGRISIDSLCGGAVLERFALAMAQVGRNIVDPNTDPERARKITIAITFKPDKSRRSIKTSIATNVSLAPPVADETIMLVGQDIKTGHIEMNEYGDSSQSVRIAGENLPVRTEEIRPGRTFDQETGEIMEPSPVHGRPIDLRQAN